MKKSYITTAIVAFVAVLLTTVFVIVKNNLPQPGATTDGPKVDEEAYLQAVSFSGEIEAPLLKTDIKGVYFTITTDGAVKFYTLQKIQDLKRFSPTEKEMRVTVSNEAEGSGLLY